MENKRGSFGNRFGVIAAVAGSAVGLGNIWRFPYIAGENGGAAFILLYLLISIVIAIPVMFAEFSIGRHCRKNVLGSFRAMNKGKGWHAVGYLSVLTVMVVLSFYCVISGWTLDFIKESLLNNFAGKDVVQHTAEFNGFVDSLNPVWWSLGFLLLNCVILSLGVDKGIERCSKVFMPLLFVMLLGLAVNSLFLPGAGEALGFLFKPDLSKISWEVVLQALGQSFFSMSLGMGIMITYGSYIKDSENFFNVGTTVTLANVFIAFLAGIAIFPAVFSYGIEPTSGAELVFLSLPVLFAQMPGGQIISIMFFLLLFFAAITSSFSLLEVVVAYIAEEFKVKRVWANAVAFVILGVSSTLCALSLQTGSELKVGGRTFFDFCDYTSSNCLLPIGGLLVAIFVGWVMDRNVRYNQLTNYGKVGTKFYGTYVFLIKYLIPLSIVLLFISLNV